MTPAINQIKKEKLPYTIHRYSHDPKNTSFGLEAVEKLGHDPNRVFKTLVVETDHNEMVVAVIPVAHKLNLKNIAKAAGAKKAQMADKKKVEKSSGYVLGGVSPLGQKKRLNTKIDISAQDYETIFVSGGRRGLEIELTAKDLAHLTGADFNQLTE